MTRPDAASTQNRARILRFGLLVFILKLSLRARYSRHGGPDHAFRRTNLGSGSGITTGISGTLAIEKKQCPERASHKPPSRATVHTSILEVSAFATRPPQNYAPSPINLGFGPRPVAHINALSPPLADVAGRASSDVHFRDVNADIRAALPVPQPPTWCPGAVRSGNGRGERSVKPRNRTSSPALPRYLSHDIAEIVARIWKVRGAGQVGGDMFSFLYFHAPARYISPSIPRPLPRPLPAFRRLIFLCRTTNPLRVGRSHGSIVILGSRSRRRSERLRSGPWAPQGEKAHQDCHHDNMLFPAQQHRIPPTPRIRPDGVLALDSADAIPMCHAPYSTTDPVSTRGCGTPTQSPGLSDPLVTRRWRATTSQSLVCLWSSPPGCSRRKRAGSASASTFPLSAVLRDGEVTISGVCRWLGMPYPRAFCSSLAKFYEVKTLSLGIRDARAADALTHCRVSMPLPLPKRDAAHT
ncbi:hypothetical protein C8R44DRAFT_876395 [Mycena epipterygia]|nr:hypothetical protein C8R44DRAFT_876395 [Mycena epipterygia]